MTSLPTVEKEQRAFDLGAVDFLDKAKLKKGEILDLVNMKLVSNLRADRPEDRVKVNLKLINQKMMFAAASSDFFATARSLYMEIKQQFAMDHISLWTINKGSPNMILSLGLQLPGEYSAKDLLEEAPYQQTIAEKESYFNNNILHDEFGSAIEFSREHELVTEFGAPIFALTDKQLVQLKMRVPKNAPVFGYVLMKRKKLLSEKENRLLSMLVTRTGTILYRLYKAI